MNKTKTLNEKYENPKSVKINIDNIQLMTDWRLNTSLPTIDIYNAKATEEICWVTFNPLCEDWYPICIEVYDDEFSFLPYHCILHSKINWEIAKNLQNVVKDKCVLGISNTSHALKDETIINNFEGIVCDESLKVFGHFKDSIERLEFSWTNKYHSFQY
tara:strand:+ start:1944 stop:2420 length:477 start_codon:yes stop_codon:yes gene_type:complete